MSGRSERIEPALLWSGRRFEAGWALRVDEGGSIAALGPVDELPEEAGEVTRRLPQRALLPGLVNAHSHAFQRGLRGQGERFPGDAGSFWTWREAMYGLVNRLGPEELHDLSLAAYREMLAAGITSVGEFHYLHHAGDGLDFAMDEAVQAAARAAGIRQVLLLAHYRTGGIGEPLGAAQRRFRTPDLETYWGAWERAQRRAAADPRLSVGCVAHSIRAVPLGDLRELAAETARRGLVLHMHVEEQRQEIADCVAAHGRTPMQVILDEVDVTERVTAVHGTHTEPAEAQRFLAAGGGLCICPTTEANLGDGIPELAFARGRGHSTSLGTDSNARISMVEEMRWLEYAQRLAREQRGSLRDSDGQVARPLFEAATLGGARALGLDVGALRVGAAADFLTLDLGAPSLAGFEPDSLLESWILGADAVAEVCVAGRWIPGQA